MSITLVAAGPLRNGHRVPAFHGGLVNRPALVKRLMDGDAASLALIVAPAGYGKSTLLSEWAAFDERPFIRVTLDRDSQDIVAAVASIAQGFSELGWIGADVWPLTAAGVTADGPGALRSLMRSPELAGRRFVLVLEDCHAVAPTALRAIVAVLLEELEDGSQVAIVSRAEPTLPTGRLRAHRRLLEVGVEDLKMTPAEAATLLRLAGLELEFGTVQALMAQTEGWPAGLYLAGLALRRQGCAAAGTAIPDAADHVIADYVRDEFFAELEPEAMSFLTRTSVLDELSGPLCDAVLGQSGSAATLAELVRGNLMLVSLDHRRERFRWHALFGAALRAELRRAEPEAEARLHGRASAWLQQHGDMEGAIGHAVAAGDAARAGDLLWANAAYYLFSGRVEAVEAWLGAFNPDQIAGCPALALAAAHSCLIAGRIGPARHWSLLAADAAPTGAPTATPSLEAGIAIIDAAAATTGPAQMAQHAARAYELEPDHSPWRPICCLLGGAAEHLAGNRRSAEQRLLEGVELGAVGAPSIGSLCLAQLTMIAIDDGDSDQAGEYAERAASIVGRHPSLAASPISALVFAATAATRAHAGRIDEAKQDLRCAIDLLASLGDFVPWYGAETRILLARAAIGLADTVRARTLLAEASRLARRTPHAPIFARYFDDAWAQIDTLAETALSGPSSLTIAELRILRFLPSHRSLREIAERLDVSVNTVKTQAHAIYRKLDAASRSEAIERASAAGLLGP